MRGIPEKNTVISLHALWTKFEMYCKVKLEAEEKLEEKMLEEEQEYTKE